MFYLSKNITKSYSCESKSSFFLRGDYGLKNGANYSVIHVSFRVSKRWFGGIGFWGLYVRHVA